MNEQQKILYNPRNNNQYFNKGKIKINDNVFDAYIADTAFLRRKGLQYIKKLGEDTVMLFVMEIPRQPIFWNRNCNFPLDVAFIDGNYYIRQISKLKKFKDGMDRTKSLVRTIFVIEANQGFFKKWNINVGDKLEIVDL